MEYVLKLDNISLDDCILGIADGNTKYLEKLYGATKASVFGYAFSILKNINDSELNAKQYFEKVKTIDEWHKRQQLTQELLLKILSKKSFIIKANS